MVEEFGKAINASVADQNEFQRDAFYKLIYSQVEDSLDNGGMLKGIMFWRCGHLLAAAIRTVSTQ